MDSALLSIKRILDLCEKFALSDEHPIFFTRLMTYLDYLLESDDVELGSDQVTEALVETHTMIAIDEDLDEEGDARLKALWMPILGF